MPIAPDAMAFGWSPGALSGSRGDRTVPHLLTSNSNWRKRHGGASRRGSSQGRLRLTVVIGHWCTHGCIGRTGGDGSAHSILHSVIPIYRRLKLD